MLFCEQTLRWTLEHGTNLDDKRFLNERKAQISDINKENNMFGPRAAINRLEEGKTIVSESGDTKFKARKARNQFVGMEVWATNNDDSKGSWWKECNITEFIKDYKNHFFHLFS